MRMDDAPLLGALNLKREHPPNLQSHYSSPWGTTAWREDVPVSDRPHELEAHSRWGLWTSRRLRKGHGPLEQGKYRTLAPKHMVQALLRGKDVHRLEVRTAVAFIIGPLLFVIGSVLLMSKLGSGAALLAIGSVFFTAGGWFQLEQALLVTRGLLNRKQRWGWCGIWCALTQSIGTVLFNIETFSTWGLPALNGTPWLMLEVAPNILGSVLFVISAIFGLLEVGHGRLFVIQPHHLGWWVAVVNALGCLWFMQAAIAAIPVDLSIAAVLDPQVAIRATLLGALAFTAVGVLSLAECSEDEVKS